MISRRHVGTGGATRQHNNMNKQSYESFDGVPICGDATMPSPLHADGNHWSGADDNDGVALARARREHHRTYEVLVNGERARLLILGCEVFGRWDPETLSALIVLSKYKAEEAPALLRRSAMSAWHKRWASMISIAAQIAISAFVSPASPHFTENNGDPPALGDVLAEAPLDPEVSRLPAH